MIFPPQGGRQAAIFAPQGGTRTLGAPPQGEAGYTDLPGITAGATLIDIDPSQYADADSVVDVSGNLEGTFTKTGTPTVVTRNGLSALRFANGVTDYVYASQSLVPDLTGGLTLAVVYEPEEERVENVFGLYNTSSTATGRVGINNNAGEIRCLVNNRTDNTGFNYSGRQPLVIVNTYAASGASRYTYLNGSTSAEFTFDEDPSGMNRVMVGSNGNAPCKGYIYRALVINEELDASAVSTLTDHLAGLYNTNAVAWADSTERGNTSTTETDASVFYLPPGVLGEDGDWLEIESIVRWNTSGAHAFKFYVDGTSKLTYALSSSGLEMEATFLLTRTSGTNLRSEMVLRRSDGTKDLVPLADEAVDFTGAIEIKTTVRGASADNDQTQHYFRVKKHGASDDLTVDVDASGVSNGSTAFNYVNHEVAAGTLTEARPVLIATLPATKTGTAAVSYVGVSLESDGGGVTSIAIPAISAAESRLYTLVVWRVSSSTVRAAFGYVTEGGASDFEVSDVKSHDVDSEALTISWRLRNVDGADTIAVPAYTAHVRQVDCLDVDVSGYTSGGSGGTIISRTPTSSEVGEAGKGARATIVGQWDATVSAGTRYEFRNGGFSTGSNAAAASREFWHQGAMFRTTSGGRKAADQYTSSSAVDFGRVDETDRATTWGATALSFVDVNTGADDLQIHLAYTEALP